MSQMYGYTHASAGDVTAQQEVLAAVGCSIIRAGRDAHRAELAALMEHLRPGDTLVCTQLDSLSGSLRGLQDIVRKLRARGAHLKTTAPPIDTSAVGEAFFALLDAFVAFDTNARRERHLEGIGAAKARGAYKGRPRKIDATQIRRLLDEGLGASDVAKRLGIGRASVYRLAGEIRKPPIGDPGGSRRKRRPLIARIVAGLLPDRK